MSVTPFFISIIKDNKLGIRNLNFCRFFFRQTLQFHQNRSDRRSVAYHQDIFSSFQSWPYLVLKIHRCSLWNIFQTFGPRQIFVGNLPHESKIFGHVRRFPSEWSPPDLDLFVTVASSCFCSCEACQNSRGNLCHVSLFILTHNVFHSVQQSLLLPHLVGRRLHWWFLQYFWNALRLMKIFL